MYVDKNLNQISSFSWVHDGVQYPDKIFYEWTNEQLAEVGIYRVVNADVPIPEGKQIKDYTYTLETDYCLATPVFEDVPVVVPPQVSKAQGKAALLVFGLYDEALTYIASLNGTEKTLAEIAFNDTIVWERDSQFLTQFATHLGLSDETLDNLFLAASDIKL